MRTTIVINDELLEKAKKIVNVKENTVLVNLALEALIEKHSRLRLIELGDSDKKANAPHRRRNS